MVNKQFPSTAKIRIAIVAGEASGDVLGGELVTLLRAKCPELAFVGIGGPKMQASGVDCIYSMEKLAVRGYIEVLRHLPELFKIRHTLYRHLLADPPNLFIGIDAPDFNLGLAYKLKRAGIPTIHYVSPSLWAWRSKRIHFIKRAVDEVLCLFPFEKTLYDAVGASARYVGHPLADAIPLEPNPLEARQQLGLAAQGLIFGLLPGSRLSEIDYHAQLFIETANLLATRYPEAQFIVPLATRRTRDRFQAAIHRYAKPGLAIRLLFGHAQTVMAAADVNLVASGTATLEAMLVKQPMVITYRLSEVTYRLLKNKIRLPYVGLPNILAGRFIVPELLQHDASVENLAQTMSNYIEDPVLAKALTNTFCKIHKQLRQNASVQATNAVLASLNIAVG